MSLKTYQTFCSTYNFVSIPASSETVCKYVAWLARTMFPNSIKEDVNTVRILYLGNSFPKDFILASLLKGVQRVKGTTVERKIPLIVEILISFLACLNSNNSQ